MKLGGVIFAVFSLIFWLATIGVLILTATAPCGLAPGVWCELDGPPWWGTVLAKIGLVGVLIAAVVLYAGSTWLYCRKQEDAQCSKKS